MALHEYPGGAICFSQRRYSYHVRLLGLIEGEKKGLARTESQAHGRVSGWGRRGSEQKLTPVIPSSDLTARMRRAFVVLHPHLVGLDRAECASKGKKEAAAGNSVKDPGGDDSDWENDKRRKRSKREELGQRKNLGLRILPSL